MADSSEDQRMFAFLEKATFLDELSVRMFLKNCSVLVNSFSWLNVRTNSDVHVMQHNKSKRDNI